MVNSLRGCFLTAPICVFRTYLASAHFPVSEFQATFATMGHKKLIRFEEITRFPNVLIYPENMQGRWKEHFGNDHPLTLELACGKGDYTLALGRRYPEENFIGVDVKGNRIWKGARTALDEKLPNIAFL